MCLEPPTDPWTNLHPARTTPPSGVIDVASQADPTAHRQIQKDRPGPARTEQSGTRQENPAPPE